MAANQGRVSGLAIGNNVATNAGECGHSLLPALFKEFSNRVRLGRSNFRRSNGSLEWPWLLHARAQFARLFENSC